MYVIIVIVIAAVIYKSAFDDLILTDEAMLDPTASCSEFLGVGLLNQFESSMIFKSSTSSLFILVIVELHCLFCFIVLSMEILSTGSDM